MEIYKWRHLTISAILPSRLKFCAAGCTLLTPLGERWLKPLGISFGSKREPPFNYGCPSVREPVLEAVGRSQALSSKQTSSYAEVVINKGN